ncbi:NUDIX domain-containing protein [Hathewaya limosa]|uniref:8-oxo-dGTP pyrophosphatase MutT (NUDIX family) n=1 Tax=Hathewaya limosa TaxID=1536 RepID=A0ABU0JT60_HATLI|nr:NUDIX domain-containing protein [Hathewaya limosa]MDQ0480270.1 8-oxo-dGTP pyrophosphatase MutT (NUDIX family) [Hathewaya limosa]
MIEKVTMLISRRSNLQEILAIEHPYAGYQLPSGTVEDNELAIDSAIRELKEETGISDIVEIYNLASLSVNISPKTMIVKSTPVYSRPEVNSNSYAKLRKGLTVEKSTIEDNNFSMVKYSEYDDLINPSYITYEILGWVPLNSICDSYKRTFYRVIIDDNLDISSENFTDGHKFKNIFININEKDKLIKDHEEYVNLIFKD